MDPDALGRLIDRHAAALGLYARQWCAAPDDVVQAAFLKLVRLRTPPSNPAAWLYAAVKNAALDAGRADRRRRKHEAAAAGKVAWFVPPDDGAGLDAEAAANALESLPADEREVIVARLWGGLTFEEVAAAVGGSAATAYRRYAAGLARLRDKLGVAAPGEKP